MRALVWCGEVGTGLSFSLSSLFLDRWPNASIFVFQRSLYLHLPLSDCSHAVRIAADVSVAPIIDAHPLADNNPILVRAKDGMCARHCHQCYMGMSPKNNCKVCKHKFYLLDGACVQKCPKTHRGVGHGMFDRRCVLQNQPSTRIAPKKITKTKRTEASMSGALSPIAEFDRARRESGAKSSEVVASDKECAVPNCRRCGAMGLCIVCKPTL
jgi:hypothetical protein